MYFFARSAKKIFGCFDRNLRFESAPPHTGGEHKGEQNVVPQDSPKICTRFTHKSLNLPLQYAKFSRASRENLNIPFKIHKNIRPFKNPNIPY